MERIVITQLYRTGSTNQTQRIRSVNGTYSLKKTVTTNKTQRTGKTARKKRTDTTTRTCKTGKTNIVSRSHTYHSAARVRQAWGHCNTSCCTALEFERRNQIA